MPQISNVGGYCSRKKGRYWITWFENGQQFSQSFTSSFLAIAFAKGLARAAAESLVAENDFWESPEGPLYSLHMFVGGRETGMLGGAVGRDLLENGNAWTKGHQDRGFEIRRGEDVIIKGGNRA